MAGVNGQGNPDGGHARHPGWLRRLPLAVILCIAVVGAVWFRDAFSLEALAARQAALIAFRDAHFLGASALFVLAYAVIVAFSLPGATLATLTGGFLFGMVPGVAYNVVAATIGAVAIFLAARAGFGADLAQRMAQRGGAVARLQAALNTNVWSALLIMRLVPAVPFFLANLIPAFLGVRLLPFAVTTFLGIIPAAVVFTSVGTGLGTVLAQGGRPDLSVIFSPAVLGPILGLAALSALPAVLNLFRKRV